METWFYFYSPELYNRRGASVWKWRVSHLPVTKERQLIEGCLQWLLHSELFMWTCAHFFAFSWDLSKDLFFHRLETEHLVLCLLIFCQQYTWAPPLKGGAKHTASFGLVSQNPGLCITELVLASLLLLTGLWSGLQVLCLSESIAQESLNCRFSWARGGVCSWVGEWGLPRRCIQAPVSLCSASDHRSVCLCERMIKPSQLSVFGEPRQHGRWHGYA